MRLYGMYYTCKKYIEYVKDMKVYAKNTGGNTSWSINSWKEKKHCVKRTWQNEPIKNICKKVI